MSKKIAVFIVIALVALQIVVIFTESQIDSGEIIMPMSLWIVGGQVLTSLGITVYCLFALLHSIQHITSPKERSEWLLGILFFNIFGACWYYTTTYQTFRKAGQGRLLKSEK